MKIVRGLVALFALLVTANVRAADDPAATASKVLSCYKAGNDTPLSMYACAGVWVTPRILSLCFLETDCPVVPDSIDARGMIAAALGGDDKLEAKISIDLANVLGVPSRSIIKECQPFTDETGFKECVSKRMTQPAVQPVLNCAAAATDKDRAVCLVKTAPKEVAGAAAAIECIANNGGGTAALKQCAKVQPWDKVEAVSACVSGATAAGAKVDCLLTGIDPKQQELGRCLAAAGGRSADAIICMGKLDPAATAKLQELQCAGSAGADGAKVAACFAASAKGDEAKLALCALGDKQKAASCLLATRPEYKTAAQVVACAQGGRDAGSLVANCGDFLVKDPKTRATLACAGRGRETSRE